MLQWLQEDHLFIKGEKCEFQVQSVSFLGFIVEQGWLQVDPAKIKAVVEWPEPVGLVRSCRGFWALQISTGVSSVISVALLCLDMFNLS